MKNKVVNKLKTFKINVYFKIASWLYNNGIVAPEILEHRSLVVLPTGYGDHDIKFYREKQNEIKEYQLLNK